MTSPIKHTQVWHAWEQQRNFQNTLIEYTYKLVAKLVTHLLYHSTISYHLYIISVVVVIIYER